MAGRSRWACLWGLLTLASAAAGPPAIHPPENASAKDVIVAAHYAPWYQSDGTGWVGEVNGKKTRTAYTPLLGRYDNRTAATLSKHIEWATAYGIDAFMIEWWGVYSGHALHDDQGRDADPELQA